MDESPAIPNNILNTETSDGTSVVLVFFIGGCTFAEVSFTSLGRNFMWNLLCVVINSKRLMRNDVVSTVFTFIFNC